MKLNAIFKVSALAATVSLAACGGDINISEGDIIDNSDNSQTVTNPPTTPTDPTDGAPGTVSSNLSNQVSSALGQSVEVRVLEGRITDADATDGVVRLTNDIVWALDGPVFVGNDNADSVTLEIEEGTIIFGRSGNDYLVVSRGSQIDSQGSATAPVIMTSFNDVVGDEVQAGQWGGLVILGNAPATSCPQDNTPCAIQVEGVQEGAVFGGTDDADDSGSIRYTVLKYAGFEIAPDNELNGVTFGGVGSATEVEYLQVHANADDGVEFFGGSVSIKYLVLTSIQDDSVDWDRGYRGNLQFVYVEQAPDNSDANRGIEGDGDGGDGTDFSLPTIANMTIIGNNFDGEDDSEGVLLRDQTGARIMNLLVTGPEFMGECLEMDTDDTVQGNLTDGDITISNSVIACNEPFNFPDTAVDLNDWFVTQQTDNQLVAFSDRANLGLNIDGTLTTESTLRTTGGDPTTLGAFFDAAGFVGAVGDTDWRQGWAFGFGGGTVNVVQSVSGCPAGTTTIPSVDGSTNTCQLSGRYTSDITLTEGNFYALDGAVFIGGDNTDSATLTVEPGVVVYGASGNDYLVVSRGSQINANGTEAEPITFTSQQHVANGIVAGLANGEAGQWGGMVLLGNAPATSCPQDNTPCAIQVEGVQEGAVFGGTDPMDNSGTLRYVRVMHGGFEIAPDNELNGITFGGIGSNTVVEYLQVHKNADDGIEFFGGSMNAKYVVLTGIQDDSVDWDRGYQGKLQFVLVVQAADNTDANRGIEGDGDGGSGTDFSNPMVANMTIIGNTFDGEDDSEGVLLRDQTGAQLYNFVITGPDGMGECLEMDTDDTVQGNLADGGITLANSVISCIEPFNFEAPFVDLNDWFLNQQTGNTLFTDGTAVVNGIFTIDATAPRADLSSIDAFFTDVDFIGAVRDADNNWTDGWTVGL
ncbi:MAG: hypothetical protein AAGJ37_09950 [Pseudomonadota bacterium]